MAVYVTDHNMAVIKCRRSRGYKPDTKQAVALAMYNLAVEGGLQELLSVGQVVIVLSVQLVLAVFNVVQRRRQRNAELIMHAGKPRGRQRVQLTHEFNARYVTTYSARVSISQFAH